MNETLKTIKSRRSVRNFKPEQITDDELNMIVEAGQYAPSAANQQSWHIVAIQNKDILKKLSETFKGVFLNSGNPRFEAIAKAEGFNPFYNAPTYIMVFGDGKAIAPTHDCCLALENMMLAAQSQGIGSCWLHAVNFVFAKPEGIALEKEFGIPEGYVPVGAAAFGYKAVNSPEAAPRRDGTVSIIK
jgi:nitroreductase